MDTLHQVVKEEGVSRLWLGAGPTIAGLWQLMLLCLPLMTTPKRLDFLSKSNGLLGNGRLEGTIQAKGSCELDLTNGHYLT